MISVLAKLFSFQFKIRKYLISETTLPDIFGHGDPVHYFIERLLKCHFSYFGNFDIAQVNYEHTVIDQKFKTFCIFGH